MNKTLEKLIRVDELSEDELLGMIDLHESYQVDKGGSMKRKLLIFLIVLTILFSTSTIYAKSFDYDLFNIEFQTLVNEERVRQGRTPLEISRILLDLADKRSDEMAEYGDLRFEDENGNLIPHRRPDGRDWSTVFDDNSIKYRGWIGENLAQIYIGNGEVNEKDVATKLFQAWKNSPSHYENMMSHNFKSMAVGFEVFIDKDGSRYAISTNLFASLTSEGLRNLNPNYTGIIPEKEIPVEPTPETPEVPKEEIIIPEIPIEEPVEKPIEKPVVPPIEQPKPLPPCYWYTEDDVMNALVNLVLWDYSEVRK